VRCSYLQGQARDIYTLSPRSIVVSLHESCICHVVSPPIHPMGTRVSWDAGVLTSYNAGTPKEATGGILFPMPESCRQAEVLHEAFPEALPQRGDGVSTNEHTGTPAGDFVPRAREAIIRKRLPKWISFSKVTIPLAEKMGIKRTSRLPGNILRQLTLISPSSTCNHKRHTFARPRRQSN